MNPKDLVGAKKAPLSLVPPALVIGASEGLAVGAEKYGPFNWRQYPVEVMTYVEAALRHLAAFADGEDCASDSGVHHLKHVVAGLAVLLDRIAMGIAVDNRPPKGPAPELLALLDRSQPDINALLRLEALGIPVSMARKLEVAGYSDPETDGTTSEPWGTGDGPVLRAGRKPCCGDGGDRGHYESCPEVE